MRSLNPANPISYHCCIPALPPFILKTLFFVILIGEFDHDVIHGEGQWTWPDGSSYAGQSKHGYREGKGLYVTDMRVSVL